MIIRRATAHDAAAIANVHIDSWQTTYAEIIPADFLQALDYDKRAVIWESNIQREDNVVFVVENEEHDIIGFADTSRRETNNDIQSIDLTSLYLLQHYQRSGIGKQLMHTLFMHYKLQRYEKVYVDVLADNDTRYFYEHLGAKPVKTSSLTIGGKVLEEVTYVWDAVEDVLQKLGT